MSIIDESIRVAEAVSLNELWELLPQEADASREEGVDVPEELFYTLKNSKGKSREQLLSALRDLYSLNISPSYPYWEPEEFKEIISKNVNELGKPSPGDLKDKVRGGLVGRCAGCILGKPVEVVSLDKVISTLKPLGEYPISYFLSLRAIGALGHTEEPILNCSREKLSSAVRDDDLDYTILNSLLLKERGETFSTMDVAQMWLNHLPYMKIYTAERVAYRNLTLGYTPPHTAKILNPYREWIGARIRCDPFGYISPGDPTSAARMAYTESLISHVKNGVYSSMFTAAMISSSFILEDPKEIIKTSLSVIPQSSRLYEAIEDAMKEARKRSWNDAIHNLLYEGKYSKYHPVHAIPNDIIVAVSLICGGRDFGESISIAVSSGLDTDCNGATVGSILGVLLGYSHIPNKWRKHFSIIETILAGYSEFPISTLTETLLKLID